MAEKKPVIEIVECIYVNINDKKSRNFNIINKFMQWALDNNILSIRGPGGYVGPNGYGFMHRKEHQEKIVQFFKDEGVDVTIYTT